MVRDRFRPKRRLGQNFLTNQRIAERLIKSLKLNKEEAVLEIGAGKGILTKLLAQEAKIVYACEVDQYLIEMLHALKNDYPNIEIIGKDILSLDLSSLFHSQLRPNLKIIGNIPYSLSSEILFYLLNFHQYWTLAVLTLQKEFAQRLLAKPNTKEYGALTVIFDLLTTRQKLFTISPGAFIPRPKVFSTAVLIRPFPHFAQSVGSEDFFKKIVKIAFQNRRKTLLNNLTAGLKIEKPRLVALGQRIGISMDRRAESLSCQEFVKLANGLYQ